MTTIQAIKASYQHTREINIPDDWSGNLSDKEKERLEASKERLTAKLQAWYDEGFNIVYQQYDTIMGILYKLVILGKDKIDLRNH